MELKDRWVSFQIRNVYYPQPAAVLTALHGDDRFKGRVVGITDGGVRGPYAIVEVTGLTQPLIVSVQDLLDVYD